MLVSAALHCSSTRGQSALSQKVSFTHGGCSRLTHACIQAQTHVHADVHARGALASSAHGECSPCIHAHTRASKRGHACMHACTHACVTMVSFARGGRCRCTRTHAHKARAHHTSIPPYIDTHIRERWCMHSPHARPTTEACCGLPPAARVTHRRAHHAAV